MRSNASSARTYSIIAAVNIIAIAGFCVALFAAPDMRRLERIELVAGPVVVFLTVTFLALRSKRSRVPYIVAIVAILLGLLGWGVAYLRQPDAGSLRAAYVQKLMSHLGEKYAWGGEFSRGIDCSGLARVAYMQAMAAEGFAQKNPRLLGPQLWRFWWRDVSARDIRGGQYGFSRKIGAAKKLAGFNASILEPGDLAVSGGGEHVLIYCGGNRWIEANPGDKQVVINEATAGSKRIYFNYRMTFHRWQLLDD